MFLKILKFGTSGLIATAIHFVVAWAVFRFATPNAGIANVVAFVVANIFSYVLHTLWSFSSRMGSAQFFRFSTVSIFGLILSAGIPYYIGPSNFWLSTALVMVAVPLTSFFLHNFWTYKRRTEGKSVK